MTTKRGRKSTAELSVVAADFNNRRPDPPSGLTERQIEIWQAVVDTESVDFFRSAAQQALLADYCRHRESVEMISETIALFKPESIQSAEGVIHYRDLTRMRDTETRAAAALATKLRMTNQSRYTPQAAATAAKNAATGKRPWE